MEINLSPICGIMFGFEIVEDEDELVYVLDLFILRILICGTMK